VADIFNYHVLIEEKLDGSQFSFSVDPETGELKARSKKAVVDVHAADNLFAGACNTALRLYDSGVLTPGWVYRGESIMALRHNGITYERVPNGNFVLFDVEVGQELYLDLYDKMKLGKELGLEVTPVMYYGNVVSQADLDNFLTYPSMLGGIIEGVVIKAYGVFDASKRTLMAKYVRPEYKEVQKVHWKNDNPNTKEQLAALGQSYNTEPRWNKALIHLEEQGLIEHSVRDISALIKEVQADCLKEGKEEIKEQLWRMFKREIKLPWGRGVAEWYKQKLVERQFGEQ